MSLEDEIASLRAESAARWAAQEAREAARDRRLDEIARAVLAPVSIVEWARRRGISRATAYRRVNRGEVPVIHEGGRRLVPVEPLRSVSEAEIAAIAARARR